MPIDYNVVNAGGVSRAPQKMMLETYAWMRQGPELDDAVVFNKPIDPEVTPVDCVKQSLTKGRIFSLSKAGTMIPGVWDTDPIPVAAILIGSDANDGDVLGGVRIGLPETDEQAYVPIKDEANAPFWSMNAGYIYETTEYDSADTVNLVPTTPLTATPDMNDFDVAGVLKPGTVYVDHIVGTVYQEPTMCGSAKHRTTLWVLGGVVPRIPADTIALLR